MANAINLLGKVFGFGPRYHGKIAGGLLELPTTPPRAIPSPYEVHSGSVRFIQFDGLPTPPPRTARDIAEGQELRSDIVMPLAVLDNSPRFQYYPDPAVVAYFLTANQWFYKASDGTVFQLAASFSTSSDQLTINAVRLSDDTLEGILLQSEAGDGENYIGIEAYPAPNGKKAILTFWKLAGDYTGSSSGIDRVTVKNTGSGPLNIYKIWEGTVSGGSATTFPSISLSELSLPALTETNTSGATHPTWEISPGGGSGFSASATITAGAGTLYTDTTSSSRGLFGYVFGTDGVRRTVEQEFKTEITHGTDDTGASLSASGSVSAVVQMAPVGMRWKETKTLRNLYVDGVLKGGAFYTIREETDFKWNAAWTSAPAGSWSVAYAGKTVRRYRDGTLYRTETYDQNDFMTGAVDETTPKSWGNYEFVKLSSNLFGVVEVSSYQLANSSAEDAFDGRPTLRCCVTPDGVFHTIDERAGGAWGPAGSANLRLSSFEAVVQAAWNPRSGEVAVGPGVGFV